MISADVMQEGPGRSKGCGIVVFADERDAQRAIAELNETELKGRNIFVREDREVGGGADRGPLHSVYVGNLAYPVEWWALKDHFKQAGDVVHAEVMQESDGRSKGCGIVSFGSAEEAQARCGAARHASPRTSPAPSPHLLPAPSAGGDRHAQRDGADGALDLRARGPRGGRADAPPRRRPHRRPRRRLGRLALRRQPRVRGEAQFARYSAQFGATRRNYWRNFRRNSPTPRTRPLR